MTLFDATGNHNFPSLIFYETGYDLFTLRQASRRSWRIGQKHPCRVYYLYYQETMQARAMELMARKLDASLALEGQFSAEGLAAMSAESGSLTMELAKSLVENIDFGEAERVWERFRSEPAERARNCPKMTSLTIIQEEKPQFIQKQIVQPIICNRTPRPLCPKSTFPALSSRCCW